MGTLGDLNMWDPRVCEARPQPRERGEVMQRVHANAWRDPRVSYSAYDSGTRWLAVASISQRAGPVGTGLPV